MENYINRLTKQVRTWIAAEVVKEPAARCEVAELYASFVRWGLRSKLAYIGPIKGFSMALEALGYERYRSGGTRYFLGIAPRRLK